MEDSNLRPDFVQLWLMRPVRWPTSQIRSIILSENEDLNPNNLLPSPAYSHVTYSRLPLPRGRATITPFSEFYRHVNEMPSDFPIVYLYSRQTIKRLLHTYEKLTLLPRISTPLRRLVLYCRWFTCYATPKRAGLFTKQSWRALHPRPPTWQAGTLTIWATRL